MRIVIDMQGAQSSGSWNRGIGRYTMSLARALVRNRGGHDVLLILNGAFPESIDRIREAFEGQLSQEKIRVWYSNIGAAFLESKSKWPRLSGELVREAFIVSLQPDILLVSSLFEGLVDDAVTTLKKFTAQYSTAVILYDLIPYIHRRHYLSDPMVEAWYLEKIDYLKQADLWLAISESSRWEGIEYLSLPSARCANISTDADECFQSISVSSKEAKELRERHGLFRDFVMYTGGIDHRKNIEGLVRAYAKLDPVLRSAHQLVIVCSVSEESRSALLELGRTEGLGKEEIIFTGFVSESDLIALYNLCAAFVFPSWHEGFGLPALEAMRCGAPVIAANASSLPEVIGLVEALFDPHSDESIANLLTRVLTDDDFRARLIDHGARQAALFSWEKTARLAFDEMERLLSEKKPQHAAHISCGQRPKLAYVSPLPPLKSGISDYSAELLPALALHYEIEVVVQQEKISDPWVLANCSVRSIDWFVENAGYYDRVLYHFGNSEFHQHMFGLLARIPGVVVLHDFYLSGVRHHMESLGYEPGCFGQQLYKSHGYIALQEREQANDVSAMIWKYPCNRDVIENSIGVIVHSENSIRLAKQWGGDDAHDWAVVPLLRREAKQINRLAARRALGLPKEGFVVCSFGMVGPTKLNHRILKAWFDSELCGEDNCQLVFVGENHPGEYGNDLLTLIKSHPRGQSVHIVGWADQETFHHYLAAADLGVQLRTLSRGETSAAVLDCMNYGLATIVNSNGSMAYLAEDSVWKLPDDFSDNELVQALETLRLESDVRKKIGSKAKSTVMGGHAPAQCAGLYEIAIEDFYKKKSTLNRLINAVVEVGEPSPSDKECLLFSEALASTFATPRAQRKILFDISGLIHQDNEISVQRAFMLNLLKEWLSNPPKTLRVEPICAIDGEGYRYARKFTLDLLGIANDGWVDEPIDYAVGDIFIRPFCEPQIQVSDNAVFKALRRHGVQVRLWDADMIIMLMEMGGLSKQISLEFQINGEFAAQVLQSVICIDGSKMSNSAPIK